MTTLGELAELTHPQPVAQLGAPLGEPDRAPFTQQQARRISVGRNSCSGQSSRGYL